MTALKTREIEGFIARPDPAAPIILLYGPDAGLVRERADALTSTAVDDPNDPFSLVKLDGDELAAEPSRLVEEAMTFSMFGSRRAIRVRAGSRNFASAVQTLTEHPPKDCRIIIEAGELRRDAPLRTICERSRTAVAIPCYADTERDLARLIDEELRAAKLRLAPDARATLIALLGSDRQNSRNEIRKLMLFAHGQSEVTLDDVRAVVTDASALALDAIIDGAFAGTPRDVDIQFGKAMAAGTYPGLVISQAQRQAGQIHKARLHIENGGDVAAAIRTNFPRLHFSREGAINSALRLWTAERIMRAMDQLADAALETRKRPALAEAIALRALLAISTGARARN